MIAHAAAAVAEARRRPRHMLLGAFVAGLLCTGLPVPVAAVSVAGSAALGGAPVLGAAAAVAAAGGAMAGRRRLAALDATALQPARPRSVAMRLALLERPRERRYEWSALARIEAGGAAGEKVVLRIRRSPPPVAAGAVLDVRGRLRPVPPHAAHDRIRGAHAWLSVDRLVVVAASRAGGGGAIDRLRTDAEQALGNGLPDREEALARGMVLGQDDALDPELRDQFRRSGLAHLVAASGSNVMLLAALALPLAAFAGLGLRARLVAVLGLIAVYVPLAGAGPSIQRAGVMGAAGLVAVLAGRPAARWYALLIAACATLLVNPRARADPGWQLSFAAVIAIMALTPALRDRLRRAGVPRPLAEGGALTIAATLGTAPLSAHHFGQVSLAALPANLLALPAVAPVMWLGAIAIAAGMVVPAVATACGVLAAAPLAYLEWLARACAALPGAAVDVPLGSPVALVVVYAAPAALVAHRRVRALALRWLPLVLAACAALWLARPVVRPPDGVRISFLNVGQGDATLLQDGAHAVLVDTGPPDGGVLAQLRRAGVTALDILVVTHAQADHEGGAAAVLRAMPVGVVVDGGIPTAPGPGRALPTLAAQRGAAVVVPRSGMRLRAGRWSLRVLWPPPRARLAPGGDPNALPVVAVATAGRLDVALTADAETPVTAAILREPAEVLKVAHHGSADAGLPALLARLRPRIAVIEVGARNTYGHPTPSTLAALRVVGHTYRTDRDGTVRIAPGKGGLTVEHAP